MRAASNIQQLILLSLVELGLACGNQEVEPCLDCIGCEGWKSASCAYAERCGMESPRCASQYAPISCQSESRAEDCAYDIHDSECGRVKDECRARAIADTASAIAGCQRYREAVCESAASCGFVASLQECLDKPAVDCAAALALAPGFERCLQELSELRCQQWVPPDACIGVVITTQ